MRKPDLYVIARFLDALDAQPDGRSKSDLQRAARVNYDIFRSYLDVLTERGLAERRGTGRKESIHITDDGQEARRRLLRWVNDVLGGWPG